MKRVIKLLERFARWILRYVRNWEKKQISDKARGGNIVVYWARCIMCDKWKEPKDFYTQFPSPAGCICMKSECKSEFEY